MLFSMSEKPSISWNPALRLAISDVDETIAGVYEPVEYGMAEELSSVLDEGISMLMVSGGGLPQIKKRLIDYVPSQLRRQILIGHCNGAEVWGFNKDGGLHEEPFYSAYQENFTEGQKRQWRHTTARILGEFGLRTHETRPTNQFLEEIGRHHLDIMYDDRGPQITLELVNAYDLSPSQVRLLSLPLAQTNGVYDLRLPVLSRANELFLQEGLPATARLGGIFAVDFAVAGVNKATAVRHVMESQEALASIGLDAKELRSPDSIEVWGDKFSVKNGGTDAHMSEALDPNVRSIDFRSENPDDFLPGYNIVLWDGAHHLQHGLLEYLQSRH